MRKRKQTINMIIYCVCAVFAVIFGILFFSLAIPKPQPSQSMQINQVTIENASETSIQNASTHSLQPILTNQWYSSAVTSFPSQPLFALPLAYRTSASGLSFSYPNISATANSIVAPYVEDFTVGFSKDVRKPTVDAAGDWSIGFSMATDTNEKMSFAVTHGIPFTVVHITGKIISQTFPTGFSVFNTNTSSVSANTIIHTNALAITTRGHYYIEVFPKKVSIHVSKNSLVIDSPQRIFIGLLDKKEHYDLFKSIANTDILGSSMSFQANNDRIATTYQLNTDGPAPLIALYPNQYDFLIEKPTVLGSYSTIRGGLRLIKASKFTTSLPYSVPTDAFKKTTKGQSEIISQITKDIDTVITTGSPASYDYVLGTWFGKVSNLLLLADTYGLTSEKNKLLQYVEPIFLSSSDYFSYDKKQTSFVASREPEFGNEKLNDHHFHYGYYIRTAAVISQFDPTFTPKIKDFITNMVSDIASTQRDADKYPFLRHFDVYEGHSWADGYADFAAGENQESSSEAMNAWYGIYLWSKTINDSQLESYALYLYNTEIQSAYYYWFDIKNIYQLPYQHAIASLVWSGKIDYSTWFSDNTNMKYGIQLLPFTPASMYLSKLPEFDHYAKDYHANGGSEKDPWGELFVMWESFYHPDTAMQMKNTVTKFEDNNPRSLFLYFLYSNSENK